MYPHTPTKPFKENCFTSSLKELILSTEISLCKLWDVPNKNTPWGHFSESIHSLLSTDLESPIGVCMHEPLGRHGERCRCPWGWMMQQGVCWPEGTMLSAQPSVQAMLWAALLGHAAGELLTNPIPSMHSSLLTSVKKPAIPAWQEPCSSPYFFLYSGWRREENKPWSSPVQHTFSTQAVWIAKCTAWRDTSTQGSWVLPMDQSPVCAMAASSPTEKGKARGLKLGDTKQAVSEQYDSCSITPVKVPVAARWAQLGREE